MTQTFFRFHHRNFFEPSARLLFVNFLECHHTFWTQQRFAGSEINSGFFFSDSDLVAASELAHYGAFDLGEEDLDPTNQQGRFAGRIWLTAEMELDNLLDLRIHEILQSFLLSQLPDYSKLKRQLRRAEAALDVMLLVLPEDEGGGFLTNWIGMRAKEEEFTGILFPSVRCLSERSRKFLKPPDGYYPHFTLKDVRETRMNDEMGTADHVLQQLEGESNVVLFSGSKTISSIKRLSWNLEGESFGPVDNPLFKATTAEVEEARVSLAQSQRLSSEQAIYAGLITDAEIMLEYSCTSFFFFNTD
jgi:hypothetical protein